MCGSCLAALLENVIDFERVIAATGGARVCGLEAVCHRHCSDAECRKPSHCHVRTRREDDSCGEWASCSGDAAELELVANAKRLPITLFDEMYAADQRGLSATALALITSASSRRNEKCSICLDPLNGSLNGSNDDATAISRVGGFIKLLSTKKKQKTTPANDSIALPCSHTFHSHCLKSWTASHRTCPCCRIDLGEAVRERERANSKTLLPLTTATCDDHNPSNHTNRR